jgi:hypothetical protein
MHHLHVDGTKKKQETYCGVKQRTKRKKKKAAQRLQSLPREQTESRDAHVERRRCICKNEIKIEREVLKGTAYFYGME